MDKDLGVVALRNDEMVLFKELFDTIVYQDRAGSLVKKPLHELPDKPFGLAHIAPSELEWVGLVNAKAGYGFFSLRLETSVSNLEAAGGVPATGRARISTLPPTAITSIGSGPGSTPGASSPPATLTALPAGTILYEKNAYLLARWSRFDRRPSWTTCSSG